MARRQGWTLVFSFIAGAAAASVFWFHDSYLHRSPSPGTAGESTSPQPIPEAGGLKRLASLPGWRSQMVSDGKQVFLADLKEGRVWRYFRQTREGGLGKEDEGWLPLALYFGGKKLYSASEAEPPPGAAAQAQPKAGEKASP